MSKSTNSRTVPPDACGNARRAARRTARSSKAAIKAIRRNTSVRDGHASPALVHDLSLRRAQPAPPESPKAPAAVPKSPAIATWFSRPAASKKRATASSGPSDGEGTSNPTSAEAGPTPADPRELRGVPVAQAAVSKTAAPTATTASTRTVGNAPLPLGRLALPSVCGARAARTAGRPVTQPHLPPDPPPL